MDKVSFIDTPFTTKVEYERYVRGEIELPAGSMDVSDGLSEAMAGASVASAEAWGPLEYPPARKAALQQQFEAQADAGGRLPLKTVHALIFSAEERKECACRVRRQPMHFFASYHSAAMCTCAQTALTTSTKTFRPRRTAVAKTT